MTSIVVNFTPTGMIPTREMTPYVPVSVSEIVEDVHEATDIGITMVHLHARDEKTGEPTYKSEVYGNIIEKIRVFSKDLVICVSLSGRTFSEFEKRADPLRLTGDVKPDMGSLTLSSVNFNRQASVSSPEIIMRLAREMQKRGILAELEAFDLGMINYAKYLEKKELLSPPHYFNLLVGNIACAQADPLHIGVMLRELPPSSFWSLAGIGDNQLMINSFAIACGGGVRVGIEDNIWYDPQRNRLARNSDLLLRIRRIIDANEKKVMTPIEFRKRLQLQSGNGLYGRLPVNQ